MGILPPRGLMMSAAIGSLALERLVDDRTSTGEAEAGVPAPATGGLASGEGLTVRSAPEPPPVRAEEPDVTRLAKSSEGDKAREALQAAPSA